MRPGHARTLTGLAMTLAMLPSISQAQTRETPETPRTATSGISFAPVALRTALPAKAGQNQPGISRGTKMAIGAAIGGAAGMVFGEYVLGQQMDFPHGPDMLIGAGIGAALGAWAGSAVHRNAIGHAQPAPKKNGLSVIPVVSPKKKAVVVSLSLK